MKEETKGNLIIGIIFLLVFIAIALVLLMAEEYSINTENSCIVIADNSDLYYIGWANSPCGEGIDCLYTCKFVDKNGNIIYKHIK